MKSFSFSTIAAIAAFMLAFMVLPSRVNAQSTTCGPYTIQNNLNCQVVVHWVRTCNGSVCGNSTQSIPPMSSIILPPCGCPSGNCDVKTTLLSVGGNPITPNPSVSAANFFTSFTTSCPGAMGLLGWDTMITVIN